MTLRYVPLTSNDRSKVQNLLALLQYHAPTGTAQAECAKAFNDAIRFNGAISAEEQEIMLLNMPIDGLRYGNWPWLTAEQVRNSKYYK